MEAVNGDVYAASCFECRSDGFRDGRALIVTAKVRVWWLEWWIGFEAVDDEGEEGFGDGGSFNGGLVYGGGELKGEAIVGGEEAEVVSGRR